MPKQEDKTNAQAPSTLRRGGRGLKRRRRRRTRTFFTIFMIFLVALTVVFVVRMFFNIETVTLENHTRYRDDEILRLLAVEPGQNMYSFNVSELEALLLKEMPYVESVEIRRELPSKITITVTQVQSVVAAHYADGYAEISLSGKVLDIYGFQRGIITVVEGLDFTAPVIGEMLTFENRRGLEAVEQIMSAADEYEFEGITLIDVTNTSDIYMVYNDIITVQLGSMTQLEYKINFVSSIIGNQVDAEKPATLDATIPGQVNLKPGGEETSSSSISSQPPDEGAGDESGQSGSVSSASSSAASSSTSSSSASQ